MCAFVCVSKTFYFFLGKCLFLSQWASLLLPNPSCKNWFKLPSAQTVVLDEVPWDLLQASRGLVLLVPL